MWFWLIGSVFFFTLDFLFFHFLRIKFHYIRIQESYSFEEPYKWIRPFKIGLQFDKKLETWLRWQ